MFGNWTFGRRLAAGFGLAGLTLVAIAAVSYRNSDALLANEQWVTHTQQVRTDIAELLLQMTNAETGQRGYIITGNDSYLEPYQSALAKIRAAVEDVRALTSDNPLQQRRLSAISPLIDAKLAELKETIDLRRNQGFDAAVKVVASNVGKTLHGRDSRARRRGRSGGDRPAQAALRGSPCQRGTGP